MTDEIDRLDARIASVEKQIDDLVGLRILLYRYRYTLVNESGEVSASALQGAWSGIPETRSDAMNMDEVEHRALVDSLAEIYRLVWGKPMPR